MIDRHEAYSLWERWSNHSKQTVTGSASSPATSWRRLRSGSGRSAGLPEVMRFIVPAAPSNPIEGRPPWEDEFCAELVGDSPDPPSSRAGGSDADTAAAETSAAAGHEGPTLGMPWRAEAATRKRLGRVRGDRAGGLSSLPLAWSGSQEPLRTSRDRPGTATGIRQLARGHAQE